MRIEEKKATRIKAYELRKELKKIGASKSLVTTPLVIPGGAAIVILKNTSVSDETLLKSLSITGWGYETVRGNELYLVGVWAKEQKFKLIGGACDFLSSDESLDNVYAMEQPGQAALREFLEEAPALYEEVITKVDWSKTSTFYSQGSLEIYDNGDKVIPQTMAYYFHAKLDKDFVDRQVGHEVRGEGRIVVLPLSQILIRCDEVFSSHREPIAQLKPAL